MSVVCCRFVVSTFVVPCCFAVMFRRLIVVLCCVLMVLRCFFRHLGLHSFVSKSYCGD
jgi:hypothetical protein